MCRCTLIFDVHYHIIPYVHSRNLVSPGSPRHGVAQPGGGFGQGHSSAKSKGALCVPHTKQQGWPCITARAQNRLPKPFLQMQIKVCTQKAATLSYQGLKDTVTACGRKVTKNPPGSLALPLNGAHKMVAPPCCRVGPPVICTK